MKEGYVQRKERWAQKMSGKDRPSRPNAGRASHKGAKKVVFPAWPDEGVNFPRSGIWPFFGHFL